MNQCAPDSKKFNAFLSEKEKRMLGLDMPSFIKRMQNRLNKVRGIETDSSREGFLLRHNYYNCSHSPA